MGKRLWAYGQDIFRRPKVGPALDAREVADMCLRLIGIGGTAGVAYLVQSSIPGVRNLYPWAFPVIMGVVVFGLLAVHVAAEYRLRLERPKLFDVACATTFIGLPINRLNDGSYRASAVAVGPVKILAVHRGDLTNVTRLIASPEIRFTRADKQGWETTNAIRLMPGTNPLAGPHASDFAWDTSNPHQWVLTGLPLAMAKDELLPIPKMLVSVADGNEAGAHFEKGETCTLIVRLAIRTDKGAPPLPDQVIALTRNDIRDSGMYNRPIPQEAQDKPKQ